MSRLAMPIMIILALVAGGFAWAYRVEHAKFVDLFRKTTLDENTPLFGNASRIFETDSGASLDQSRRLFWKQYFHLSGHPCVIFVPSKDGHGSHYLYCFRDERGEQLLMKEIPR